MVDIFYQWFWFIRIQNDKKMEANSPQTDFSLDFQNLNLKRAE